MKQKRLGAASDFSFIFSFVNAEQFKVDDVKYNIVSKVKRPLSEAELQVIDKEFSEWLGMALQALIGDFAMTFYNEENRVCHSEVAREDDELETVKA